MTKDEAMAALIARMPQDIKEERRSANQYGAIRVETAGCRIIKWAKKNATHEEWAAITA